MDRLGEQVAAFGQRCLRSRTVWLLAGAVCIVGLANLARRGLARDSRFLARPAFAGARVPAWSGREVLDPILLRLEAMGPISLLDPEFEQRVRTAVAGSPHVAAVAGVRRLWPRRYAIDVVFHRPVAVIEYAGERHPVTHDAVVLPSEPYAHAARHLFPIRGVRGRLPRLGQRWENRALIDGIATLRQISPYLDELRPLRIIAIDVSEANDPRRGVVLRTAHGIPIRWGRPLARVGENSVAQKIRFLRTAVHDIDRLAGYEIDPRWDDPYVRRSNES